MMDKMLILLFLAILGNSLSACSNLPQIRVLHDPLDAEEHVRLGLIHEVEGRPELAGREYDRALRQKHGYGPALIGLGNLAFNRGALDEAETYYRQVLAMAPEDPNANNNLAMLYLSRGTDLQEAEQLASRALVQGGPLQPYVLDTIAHIYLRLGRYREARTALKNAEVLAPVNDTVLRSRLAQLRQELAASPSRLEQGVEKKL